MTRRLRSEQFLGEPGESFEGVESHARCAQTHQPEDRGCTREKRWPLPSAEVITCEKQGSERTAMRRKWEGTTVGTGQAWRRRQDSVSQILVSRSPCCHRNHGSCWRSVYTQHTAHESRQNYKMWIHKGDKIIRHIVTKAISKNKNVKAWFLKTYIKNISLPCELTNIDPHLQPVSSRRVSS